MRNAHRNLVGTLKERDHLGHVARIREDNIKTDPVGRVRLSWIHVAQDIVQGPVAGLGEPEEGSEWVMNCDRPLPLLRSVSCC
jgi:hypothetical protein